MATDESLLDVFVVVGIKETGENVEQYVDRVKKVFGGIGSAGAVDLSVNMDKAVVAIGGIEKNVQAARRSVGGLTNNAYQLGQAFEDAAVGFSLNGIAGAVRGASNNITFLIQNMTQAHLAQAQAAGRVVSPLLAQLPLYAAIGAAIGLIVVGPLTDWISSLNDIEFKTRGLAETLKQEFADVKFQVSMEVDARAAVRAVADAKDLQEAIAVVIKQAEDADDLKFKIITELDVMSQKRVFQDIEKGLKEMQQAADLRVIELETPKGITKGGDPFPFTKEELAATQQAKNFTAAIDTIRIAWQQAQAQAAKGFDVKGELESIRSSARLLAHDVDEVAKSGTLTVEAAAEYKKVLEEINKFAGDNTELTIRHEKATGEVLNKTLEQLALFKDISAEHQFMNEVNEGRLDQEDKILFAIKQQQIELRKQAEQAREVVGRNNPELEKALADDAGQRRAEQRIEVIAEIKDIEKDIADRRADADEDAERAAERRMDIEERIADQQIKGAGRVAAAETALSDEQAKQAADAQEKLIQERITALQKLDKQSQRSAVGDIGQQIFGDDVQPEIERLQEELKTLRDTEAKTAAKERLQELEARIVSEREESARRIEDLRKDLQEARQEEIDAVNKNAEEIQKLIDQLRQFENALLNVRLGLDPLAPEAGRELVLPPVRNDNMGFLPEEDILGMGNAQANANAAAMDGVDFKSSSLETLTDQTNKLLLALNEGVSRLDMQTRLA